MVQFSPYPQTDNDPNYLGLSKEPGPIAGNSAMGKLFQGMGDMLEMGVKGLDTITKSNLEDEEAGSLTAQRNAEIFRAENTLKTLNGGNDSVSQPPSPTGPSASVPPLSFAETATEANPLGDRSGSPENTTPPGPAPNDLQSGMRTLGKMNEANAAGKFSSTAMNMNAQAIVSDLMQRYPGYRADILKTARSLGFDPGSYLNDLKTQINQAAAKIDAKDTKDAAWEEKYASDLALLQPNYFNLPRDVRRSPEMRDKLMNQIGQYKARTTDAEDRLKQLELKDKEGQDIKKTLAETTTDSVNTMLAATLTGTSNVMGYPNVNALVADINSGQNHTPEDITRMNAAMEQFKQRHVAAALQYMRTTKIGNTTIAGKLGEDKANELANASALPLDMIQKGISDKNYSLAGAAAAEAQLRLDRTNLQISKDYPIVDRMGALEKKYGPAATQWIIGNSPQIQAALSAPAQQLLTGGTMAVALGKPNPVTNKPTTVNDVFNDFKRLGVTDDKGKINPNDAAAVMDHVKANILNSPPAMATTIARGTFSSDLFARVPAKDKLTFLTNYANQEMTAKILELSKGNPDLLNQYKTFIHTGVYASTQQTVSDFKTIQNSSNPAFNANPYYKMTFNPETNRVDLTTATNEQLYSELGSGNGGLSRYGSIMTQLGVVKKTVDDLNKGLGILDPVLKAEKKNISGEMLQLLRSTGVKMPVKDQDKGSPSLQFSDDELPSSGHVGDLGSFLTNPAGNVAPKTTTPVLAQGGSKKTSNLTNEDLLSISTDDIPEGMSARDFLQQLKNRRP